MTNKQKLERLAANCLIRLEWLGALRCANDIFDAKLELMTSGGLLTIHIDKGDATSLRRHVKAYGEPTICCFCQFNDSKAIDALGLNGNNYSGKWNWHLLTQDGVDAFIGACAGIVHKEVAA